jgi:hypothetical protein
VSASYQCICLFLDLKLARLCDEGTLAWEDAGGLKSSPERLPESTELKCQFGVVTKARGLRGADLVSRCLWWWQMALSGGKRSEGAD